MNILWLPSGSPFPSNAGGKVVISNRMIQVAKKHNIYLLTESADVDDESKKNLSIYCKKYELIPPAKRSMPYQFTSFITSSMNVGKYKNPVITAKILEYITQYNIDLINIDLPMPAVNLLPIKKEIEGIPVVINEHNLEFENVKSKTKIQGINPLLKLYSKLESRKLYKWEKKIYSGNSVKGISFVSDVDMKKFDSYFKPSDKTELFHSPIGTNLPVFTESETNKKNILVFPAAFDYAPNVHGAIWFAQNVMPLVIKSVPEAKLYLVGRNPKDEVKQLENEHITVTGTVPSVSPYMALADVFIVPIFFGGGVKTKLIEMGCWRKTVIATTSGSTGTIFKNKEDLLICDDAALFAEKCIDALKNPDKYSEMAQSMYQKTIDNYLWDNIGKDYCSFLERISQR